MSKNGWMRRRVFRAGTAILVASILAACESDTVNKEPVPSRDINAVMEAHAAELMAIPGVVGVAIGQTDDKSPCIMVLILEKKDEILNKLPRDIDGYPVCPFVSGEIKPMEEG